MDPEGSGSIMRSWETNAGAWARAVREGRIESRRLATDTAIVDAVLRREPGRVLDVGCGEGWLCRALSAHGVEAVGVDGSAPLVEAARVLGGGQFAIASYEEIARDPSRLGEKAFDAVVCNFALLEADLTPLLRGLRSLLRSGGAVLIQTVHPWSVGIAPYVDGWRTEDFAGLGGDFPEPMPWYFRTLASWVEQLRSAGLAVVSVEEPAHPTTRRPLSLVLVAGPNGEEDGTPRSCS